MKKNNKKGFTIVELVIVIAVIAILSAVLIPTFSGLVDRAEETGRKQEIRNALTNYLIANDAVVASGVSFVYLEDKATDGEDVLYIYSYANSKLADEATEVKGTYNSTDKEFTTAGDASVTYSLTEIKDGNSVIADIFSAKIKSGS